MFKIIYTVDETTIEIPCKDHEHASFVLDILQAFKDIC